MYRKEILPKTDPWETAGRSILAMLEDQYTISDRDMCNQIANELRAVRDTQRFDLKKIDLETLAVNCRRCGSAITFHSDASEIWCYCDVRHAGDVAGIPAIWLKSEAQ